MHKGENREKLVQNKGRVCWITPKSHELECGLCALVWWQNV